MSATRRLLLVLSTIGVLIVAAAPFWHTTCPRTRPGLPERDYQWNTFSQPQRALSSPAVVLTAYAVSGGTKGPGLDVPLPAPKDRPRQRIKAFQFVKKPILQIDHCSLSQISILLHETGKWTASMRANQNPLPDEAPGEPRDVTTAEPARAFTDHLRRNRFFVGIRCYGGPVVGGVEGLVGKPMVIPLYVEPFWVQQQQPDHIFASGFDPRIQDYFDMIDRVEIEFAYQYEQ